MNICRSSNIHSWIDSITMGRLKLCTIRRSWGCLTPPDIILTGRLGADRSTLSEALPAMPFDGTASLGQGTPDSHYARGVTPGMAINEVAQP